MALQVWLPLIKDARNQGLCSGIITTSGATFAEGGKLGGKYFSGGTITIPATMSKKFFNKTGISFAFWLYPVGTSGTGIIMGQNAMTAGDNRMYSIFQYPTVNDLHISWQDETSDSTFLSGSWEGFFPADTWTHCCIVYDGNTVIIYRNGEQYITINGVSNRANFEYAYPITGSVTKQLQDVRIYNHCLTPEEVKKIAQGLVLHYPLNHQGLGRENLFSWANNATSITLNDYQNVGSFTQFTNSLSFDPSTTVGKKYTISFWAKSPNGTTSLLLYNSNSKPQYFNFSTTLTNNLGTEWQFFKYTVTNTQYTGSDASTNTSIWKRIEIYAPNQMKVQVKQIKVEEGEIATPWCPNSSDVGSNATVEYDCSGFCNNGTRIGNITWSTDTPKYQVSTTINSSKIQCTTNPITGDDPIFSIGFWFKLKSNISYIAYADLVSFSSSSYSNQPFRLEICGNPVGNDIYWFRGPSGNTGGFKINTNNLVRDTWYHTVLVSEGNKQYSYYINGIKTGTYNGSANSWVPTNIFSIGDGQAGAFDISDARIYATALSAEDIQALYQAKNIPD